MASSVWNRRRWAIRPSSWRNGRRNLRNVSVGGLEIDAVAAGQAAVAGRRVERLGQRGLALVRGRGVHEAEHAGEDLAAGLAECLALGLGQVVDPGVRGDVGRPARGGTGGRPAPVSRRARGVRAAGRAWRGACRGSSSGQSADVRRA